MSKLFESKGNIEGCPGYITNNRTGARVGRAMLELGLGGGFHINDMGSFEDSDAREAMKKRLPGSILQVHSGGHIWADFCLQESIMPAAFISANGPTLMADGTRVSPPRLVKGGMKREWINIRDAIKPGAEDHLGHAKVAAESAAEFFTPTKLPGNIRQIGLISRCATTFELSSGFAAEGVPVVGLAAENDPIFPNPNFSRNDNVVYTNIYSGDDHDWISRQPQAALAEPAAVLLGLER